MRPTLTPKSRDRLWIKLFVSLTLSEAPHALTLGRCSLSSCSIQLIPSVTVFTFTTASFYILVCGELLFAIQLIAGLNCRAADTQFLNTANWGESLHPLWKLKYKRTVRSFCNRFVADLPSVCRGIYEALILRPAPAKEPAFTVSVFSFFVIHAMNCFPGSYCSSCSGVLCLACYLFDKKMDPGIHCDSWGSCGWRCDKEFSVIDF